jgi:hypothetical protein
MGALLEIFCPTKDLNGCLISRNRHQAAKPEPGVLAGKVATEAFR